MYVHVDIACNDPDNGMFVGRAEQIAIYTSDCPDVALELAALRRAPRLTLLPEGSIRLAGKPWPLIGSKDWVGSWCWNRYDMTTAVAADFLKWLRGRELYACEAGWCDLFEWWRHEIDVPPYVALTGDGNVQDWLARHASAEQKTLYAHAVQARGLHRIN